MDKAVARAANYLPKRLKEAVFALSEEQSGGVRELRLRAGALFTLSTDDGERFLQKNGQLSALSTPACLAVDKEDVAQCVKQLCDYALHVHEAELCEGFLTAGGCRAGLGGTVVYGESGAPCAMRDFTSVCLRVARLHKGCADPLLREIERTQTGHILVCGRPSSGKTSLLRDVAQGLSEGRLFPRKRVAVIDERSELSLDGALTDCDVLRGVEKATGIERAVRCLSPEYLVFDEWTSAGEAKAVLFAAGSGVRVITSTHAPSFETALRRADTAALLTGADVSVIAEMAPDHGYRIVRRNDG